MLRIVAPGTGFCGVTLCDVTIFTKIISRTAKVGEVQTKQEKAFRQKLGGFFVQK